MANRDPRLYAGIGFNVVIPKDRIDEFNTFRAKARMMTAAGIVGDWGEALGNLSGDILKNRVVQHTDWFLRSLRASYMNTCRTFVGSSPEAWLAAIAPFITSGCIFLKRDDTTNDELFVYKNGKVYYIHDKNHLVYGCPTVCEYDEDGKWVYDWNASRVPDRNFGRPINI